MVQLKTFLFFNGRWIAIHSIVEMFYTNNLTDDISDEGEKFSLISINTSNRKFTEKIFDTTKDGGYPSQVLTELRFQKIISDIMYSENPNKESW